MGGMLTGPAAGILGYEQAMDDQKSILKQSSLDYAAAEGNRAAALQKGTYDAGKLRTEGGELQARQRTAYAASGVNPNVGTAAQVQRNTALQADLDARVMENNAAREALGFKIQRDQVMPNAQAKLRANERRMVSSILGGTGQFIGGASSLFGMFGG
jgi:hypothetical protein